LTDEQLAEQDLDGAALEILRRFRTISAEGREFPVLQTTKTPEEQRKDNLNKYFETNFVGGQHYLSLCTLIWTQNQLEEIYWRPCYSYFLCSIVGAFEKAHKAYTEAKWNDSVTEVKGLTMVFTGVQGTGKIVLGTFIALVMAQAFGSEVTYQWGDLSHRATRPDFTDKSIMIRDFSTSTCATLNNVHNFELLVTSFNRDRWKEREQQNEFSSASGNLAFLDLLEAVELLEMGKKIGNCDESTIQKNLKVAGGVARTCLAHSSVEKTIARAFQELGIRTSVLQLSILMDQVEKGQLFHTIPTDPFRNKYILQPS